MASVIFSGMCTESFTETQEREEGLAKDTKDCRKAPESRTEAWDPFFLWKEAAPPPHTCHWDLWPPGRWESESALLQGH